MPQAGRQQLQRIRDRGHYDRATLHAILDAGFIAHVGFCDAAQPFVIPMLYARDGEVLLLHGSIASRLMRKLGDGIEACVSVTHVDGLVLARSQFNHAVNYRSVVAFGRATLIADGAGKQAALAHFVESMLPGRSRESRAPNRKELAATAVLRFSIIDASAKIRAHGARDEAADMALPFWAGVVPLAPQYGTPCAEPECTAALPDSVQRLVGARGDA